MVPYFPPPGGHSDGGGSVTNKHSVVTAITFVQKEELPKFQLHINHIKSILKLNLRRRTFTFYKFGENLQRVMNHVVSVSNVTVGWGFCSQQ
jgi:hypothetical protein